MAREKTVEKLIDFAGALDMVRQQGHGPRGTEQVSLEAACGRIVAREIAASEELPPFNKSAMDGFAVRAADLAQTPVTLPVVMDIPAGTVPQGVLAPKTAASVMTGAPLPEGADAVVQVEWTSGFGEQEVTVNTGVAQGANVSPQGEIVSIGQKIIDSGTLICAEEVSLLASLGVDPVMVYRRPSVAVLSTGNELVPASDAPSPAQIRDSNGPALASFLRRLGLEPALLGPVSDNVDSLHKAIGKGLEYDCLLITGGVSVGSYDFVEKVLLELDLQVHFRRLAIKPGKPTVYATGPGQTVFGLPGNPVSALVLARVLVTPALRKLIGHRQIGPRMVKATLLDDIRKKPDRLWFVHGLLGLDEGCTVEPLGSRGSADSPRAVEGDCLIVAPQGQTVVEHGTLVDVVIWERCL